MKKLLLALAFLGFINQALAQTVAAPTGVVAMVCANNTAVPTPTAGQFYYVQCDANGRLVTNAAGFSLLAKSGVASSHTGDTNESILATITIPANTIGANGVLRVTSFWSMPSSANNKTLRHRLGGIGGTAVFSTVVTTVANMRVESTTIAANATNAQNTISYAPRGTDQLVTANTVTTSALDMTTSQTLVITDQNASAGETVTLIGFVVESAT